MKPAVSSWIVGLFFLYTLPVTGQSHSGPTVQEELAARSAQATVQRSEDPSEAAFKRASPFVFVVEVLTGKGQPIGITFNAVAAGPNKLVTVISSANGALLATVQELGAALRARKGTGEWPASVMYVDRERGLCWLGVKGLEVPPLRLRPSATVKDDEAAYLVSARRLEDLGVQRGSISRGLVFRQTGVFDTTLDSFLSEGGGIFDGEGRLIGIAASFVMEGRQWSFAIPAEWISPREGHVVASPSPKDYEFASWHLVAWREIGFGLKVRGDGELASRAFQKVLDYDPTDAAAWYSLGGARRLAGDFEGAISAYKEAIRFMPASAGPWLEMGDAYLALNQNAKAIEAYETAVKHNAKDFRVWRGMWLAYERLGQMEKAMAAYEQANQLESDPTNDNAPFLAKIVEANPGDAEAWYELGQAHARMKRFREAVQAYLQSVQLNPLSDTTWFHLGYAHTQLKEYRKAVEAYARSARLKPTKESWFALGSAHRDLKQWQEAAEAFKESVRLEPQGLGSWFFLGESYCKLGNAPGMIEVHDRLRVLSPSTADVFFREVVQKSASKCAEQKKSTR